MLWLALAPPVFVFILGFFTRRICLSLFFGIVIAALIAADFQLLQMMELVILGLWNYTHLERLSSFETFKSANNFFIIAFVFILGMLIEMIRQSHGAAAFVHCVSKWIKTKKSAETGTLLLSHCLSIDDYLSSLTVGSVMRPLTDKFNIPRVKLAFLTDSMAAPLAMITPISSWAAAIIGFLIENGVDSSGDRNTLLLANPYTVYLSILPYIFYSSSLILSVWCIVRFGLSFGLMHQHEEIARETGNLAGGKPIGDKCSETCPEVAYRATLTDFTIPIGSLMLSTLFFLLYFGEYILFGGSRSLVETLQSAPISLVLVSSGFTTLSIAMFYYWARGIFSLSQLIAVASSGLKLMLPVAAILLFAWTMGGLLRENLKTGELLASLFADTIPITLMPLILFWNATVISLALGSSWATTAILLPIAIPMVISMTGVSAPATLDSLPVMLPVFGAILSGAVCGDHVSLISETTIMAVTSSMCDFLDHVKTQIIYAGPTFLGCSAAYLVNGLMLDSSQGAMLAVSLCCSFSVSLTILVGLHLLRRRRAQQFTQISQTNSDAF